jgi:hypothetical protein
MKYKQKYEDILSKYNVLRLDYEDLKKNSRILTNFILRIKKKCDHENLYLAAGLDPHKPLDAESQQGPLITRLYELTQELKKGFK